MKKKHWLLIGFGALVFWGVAAADKTGREMIAEKEKAKAEWIALGPKSVEQCIDFYGKEGGDFYSKSRGKYGAILERGQAMDAISRNLNDPDSLEIAEVFYLGDDFYVTYRAKNTFNATITQEAHFEWVPTGNDCGTRMLSM